MDAVNIKSGFSQPDIAVYNGPRYGLDHYADYLPSVFNAANWISQQSSFGGTASDGVTPDLPFPTYALSIDPTAQVVQFASNSLNVTHAEGNAGATTTFTFTVERTNGSSGALAFTAAVKAEHFIGASAPADFGGTLPVINGVIADGQTSATVSVTVTGDAIYELDESFHLVLQSASNPDASSVVVGTNTTAAATISNDDAEPGEILAGQTVTRPVELSGTDFVTIDAGGAIDVTVQGTGATAITWNGGQATIDNFGDVFTPTQSVGNAVVGGKNVTGTLAITNHEGATSYGDVDTHKVGTSAVITITNAGTLSSHGKTIEMGNADAANQNAIHNLATGVITSDTAGSDIIRGGQNTLIENAGRIVAAPDQGESGSGGDAVDFQNLTGGVVHNEAGGVIEGSRHGITGDNAVTLINDQGGTVTGRNGSGINIDNDADPANTVHVTNHGNIFGQSQNYADSDGDAVDVDGLVQLDNYGSVKGLGANGYHDGEANVSEGVAAGGGTINNYAGGEIYGYGRAIQMDNSSNGPALGATIIYNEGLIQGDGNGPTGVDADDAAVMNARIAGREAIDILGTFNDTITNKGQIVGGVSTGGGDDVFNFYAGSTVSGPIDGGDGHDTLNLIGPGTGKLSANTGFERLDVQSGVWIAENAPAYADIHIATSATMTSQIEVADQGQLVVDLGGSLIVSGSAVKGDGAVAVENSGVIGGLALPAAAGIEINGGEIYNHAGGIVLGQIAAIESDNGLGGDATTAISITNEGLIQGLAGQAISLVGSQADTLTNRSTILGSVDLGGGDDTLNVYQGSSISGATVGGDGTDTVNLFGAGTGSFAAVSGFEKLAVQSGTWTVANSDDYSDIVIKSGATVTSALVASCDDHITIEQGATLATLNPVAINWVGTGHVVIDNAGTISSEGSSAVSNIDDGRGFTGSLVINNAATGVFEAGVRLLSLGAGSSVTVNNAGLMEAFSYPLEFTDAGKLASITINNLAGGHITNEQANGDVIRGGVNMVVNNAGTIQSPADADSVNNPGFFATGGDAIDYSTSTGGVVHNLAGGLIEGSHHAITGKRGMTVTNDAGATLIGRNGSGVNVDNDATVANTVFVTNHGDILGKSQGYEDSDGDAIDTDGLVHLDNYGNVKGLGANGTHDGGANVSEGVALGGGVINNYAGATIYGYGRAIQADDSANGAALAATTIYNEGTIQGDGHGPQNFEPGSDAGIVIAGREAIDILGTFADTITNKGTIIGGVFTDGGDDTFNAYTGSTSGKIDLGSGNDTINLLGTGNGTLGAVSNAEHLVVQSGTWDIGDTTASGANTAGFSTMEVDTGATVSSVLYVTGSQQVTVQAGGTIQAAGSAVSVYFDGALNGAKIDNAGTIYGMGHSPAGNNTGSLSIVNEVGGVIEAGASAGTAIKFGGGMTVSVDNYGTLGNAQNVAIALDFESTAAASTLTNHSGGVIAAGAGADVIRGWNGLTITNAGTIQSAADIITANPDNPSHPFIQGGGEAINFQKSAGTVHNEAGGLIEGAQHAVTGKKGITVINDTDGIMIGRNGSAVNMDNDANPANTAHVTNHGTMLGESAGYNDSDGDAVDVDGLVQLDNYGSIRGEGANGTHDGGANVSEGIAAGGGVINNYAGATIYGYGRAIQVDDSANGAALAATTITNEGTIQGDGHGPQNFEDGSDAGIVIANREAIDILGSFADTITNKGTIIGGVFTDGGDDTFNAYVGSTVSKTIDLGDGNDTVNLLGTGNGALQTVANAENLNVQSGTWTIDGTNTYQAIDVSGGATISGLVLLSGTETLTVEQGGSVVGSTAAVANFGTSAVTIVNEGTIKITAAPGAKFDAIVLNQTGATVHNGATGVIEGARHAITGPFGVTVINDAGGLIVGHNGSAVNMDNSADPANTAFITNHGTMLGDSANIADSDGDAIDTDGLLNLTNDGMIRGEGANGYHKGEANVSEGIASGGGVINNLAGGTIYGYGRAIQIDNSSNGPAFASTTIYNEGTIRGDGHGPTGVSVADAAAMQARITGREAIDILGSFADTITNKGTIIGGVFTDGGDDTLNVYSGSTISGPVDLGSGNDSVHLLGTGGSFGAVANAENLDIDQGSWAVATAGSYNAVTIAAGATLTSGIAVTHGMTVTVGGSLAPASGRGIDAKNGLANGSALTVDVLQGGQIVAGDDAIRINKTFDNGVVTIDNAGLIKATGGQAIDLTEVTSHSTAITITNEATGSIVAVNADAVRGGGNTTLDNYGQIVSQATGSDVNDGVDFQDDGDGMVHNHTGGTITGAHHGITGAQGITVINDLGGQIVGQSGSAVNIDNDSAVADMVTVTNYGTMLGNATASQADSDGDAVDVDGLLNLDNYGQIRGTGAHGTHDGGANVSEGVAAGGGTIHNEAGATIYGFGRAIQIDDSNNGGAFTSTTIINEGTIQGDGHGPENFDAGSDAGIVIANREAIDILGSFADTITNKGTIIGGVFTDGGDDTFNAYVGSTVSKTIDLGDGNDTVKLYATTGNSTTGIFGATANVETLDVVSGNWKLGFGFAGANIHVENGGAIISGTSGIMSISGGQTLTVDQGGLVEGAKTALFISGGDVDANIVNSGTIKVTAAAGTDKADAISLNGATATIHNTATGVIEGARHAITGPIGIHVINDAGGLIVGHNGSAVNMDNSATEDHAAFVTNHGTMLGDSANISDSDGDAVDVDGLLHLDNDGMIRGEGANGYHKGEANVSEGVAAGGGTINNFAGGTIYGYGRAIQIDNSSNAAAFASTTIYNEGTIQGDGHGPTGVSVADAAAMQARIDGREAIDILGSFADTITNKGTIIGGIFTDGGADILTNTGTITGPVDMGAGNDTVILGVGSTITGTISLGDGADLLTASANAVTVDAGAGDDTVNGGAGDDILHGGEGNDILVGGAGADMLFGDAGNNTLIGGDQNDTITGGINNDIIEGDHGNDMLIGGDGSDLYRYAQGDGSDTIVEGLGQAGDIDQLVFTDTAASEATLYRHGGDLELVFQDGDTILVKDQFTGGGVENLIFDNGVVLDRAGIDADITDRGPQAGDVTLPTVLEDAPSFFVSFADLLAHSSDADLDALTVSALDTVVGGTAQIVNGGIEFTLDHNFNGPASFGYTVDDGHGGTAHAAASFDVTPVDDAPIVVAASAATTDEDTPVMGQIVASDPDSDTLTYTIKDDGAAHGTVTVDSHGQWSYAADANYNGADAFTVQVSDGHTVVDSTVSLTINPVNDLPHTVADAATVGENDTATFDLTGNDTDVEDGVPSLSGFSVTNVSGIALSNQDATSAFSIVNGHLQYNPGALFDSLDNGQQATVTINYTAEDSDHGQSTGQFVLTINGETDTNPVTGTDQSDVLIGSNGADTINAGDGDDFVYSGDGNDIVDAGKGNDFVFAGAGDKVVNGGDGNDFLFGGSGNSVINGGEGNDLVVGGSGNETINGGAGNDLLYAGSGNDTISGGQGNDLLYGGAGVDTFVFNAGDGHDTVFSFQATGASHDIIQLDAHAYADFDALMQSGAVADTGGGTQITLDDGSVLALNGVLKTSLTVDDFHFA